MCENKNLTYFLFQYNFQKCTGQEGLTIKICKASIWDFLHLPRLKTIKNNFDFISYKHASAIFFSLVIMVEINNASFAFLSTSNF